MRDSNQRDREQRTAIVTGASSGIGEATARSLADAGFAVVLAARRADHLRRIAGEIGEKGGRALAVAMDLADEEQTQGLVDRAFEAFGRIDLLVNNAGFSPAAAIEQLPRSEIRRTFEVNLIGGLHLVGAVTPIMRHQGGGRIINMGSMAGLVGAPIATTYSATKGALEVATSCLRLELAPWNIQVSLIVPGFVDTATFDNSRNAATALRADPENPYRQLMFDLDDFAKSQLRRAISTAEVARVVLQAATAKRPRERYFVPFSARVQAGVMGAMPKRWVERILRRLYKIPAASV